MNSTKWANSAAVFLIYIVPSILLAQSGGQAGSGGSGGQAGSGGSGGQAGSGPINLLADPTVQGLIREVIRPLILFLFALALVYFLWGVVRFIRGLSRGDETGMKEGKMHMIWGVVGLAIMLSVFGIMNIIYNTVTDNGRATGITNTTIVKPPVIDRGLRP